MAETEKPSREVLIRARLARNTARRDALIAKRDGLGQPMSDDPATARVGARLAQQNWARMDRDLARYTAIDGDIRSLSHRILLDRARLEKYEGGVS